MPAAEVIFKEVDLSLRFPSFPGVYGGIVIDAVKGSTTEPTLVTSDAQLLREYTPDGKVDIGMSLAYYSALAFLQRNSRLWVMRAANAPAWSGGIASATTFAGFTGGEFTGPGGWASPGSNLFLLYAKNPGAWGNDLGVKIWKSRASQTVAAGGGTVSTTNNTILLPTFQLVTGEPFRLAVVSGALPAPLVEGATYYAIADTGLNIKVAASEAGAVGATAIDITSTGSGSFRVVPINSVNEPTESEAFKLEVWKIDTLGRTTLLESWLVSRLTTARDGNGKSIYIESVLQDSEYIRADNNDSQTGTPVVVPLFTRFAMGTNGSAVTESNMIAASNFFLSNADLQLTVLLDGGYATAGYHANLVSICEARKDCVAFLSVPSDRNTVVKMADYHLNDFNVSSSYAALWGPFVKIADRFNDRDILVPPDGYAGMALGETALNFELWYPLAGFKRGALPVKDVQLRFTQGEMSYLVDRGVNPIRFAPGRGIVIWGQKTLLARESFLQELHVRFLGVVLRAALSLSLEDFLFELNDEDSRRTLKARVDDYMASVQGRKGCRNFRTICDDTNNFQADVDAGRLIGWLFVTPFASVREVAFTLAYTNSSFDLEVANSLIA